MNQNLNKGTNLPFIYFLITHGLFSTIKSFKSFFLFMHQIQFPLLLHANACLHDPRTKLMVAAIHKIPLKCLHPHSHLCSECQLPPFNLAVLFLKKNPYVSGLFQSVNNACLEISMQLVVHSIVQWLFFSFLIFFTSYQSNRPTLKICTWKAFKVATSPPSSSMYCLFIFIQNIGSIHVSFPIP